MERLSGSPGCFVCDREGINPRSLALEIFWDNEEKKTVIHLSPDATMCGYPEVVHGGIIASVFDDAMAWAVKHEIGTWAVTAHFSIRYARPVKTDSAYIFEGHVEKARGRKITTSARLLDGKGKICATAEALFVIPRKD